ncbi:MAG: hypothetical protein ACPGSM_12215 [Thiolinea sp.]
MLSKHILGLLVASCLLTACNDNDEDTAQSTAEMTYSGQTGDAAVDADNAGRFPKAAFAARDYAISSAAIESWLTHYQGADTITCVDAGRVAVERNVDTATMLGSKTLTFANNCTANGVSLTGKMTIKVTAYDMEMSRVTAADISYHDLAQHRNGKSVTLNGTLSVMQDLSAKTANFDIDTHMKADSGEESLTIMQVAVSGNMSDRSANSSYSGKVCLKDDGCVQLTTTTPFQVNYNGYAVAGEMLVNGAENSQAKVAAQDSSAMVNVSLVN